MCTRFFIGSCEELLPYIEAVGRSPLFGRISAACGRAMPLLGEICPTDAAAVIATDRNRRRGVFPMIWGFSVGSLSAPVVNARTETAAEKPTFRESWLCRRCVIPASHYFEWEHYKTPRGKTKTGDKYAIKPKGAPVTYLAGLYRFERRNGVSLPVFTVLTREPSTELAAIHDRMPLMLPESAVDEWISPEGKPEELVRLALCDIELEKADA